MVVGLRWMVHSKIRSRNFWRQFFAVAALLLHGHPSRFTRIVSVGITLELLTSTRKQMGNIRNVNERAGGETQERLGAERAGGGRVEGSARGEHDAAGDCPFSQFGQDFVRLCQRAGCDLAMEFSIRCHGEDATQVFARANRGGFDANLGCGH